MAEDIRLSVGADTTQMESQIANAARKANVVIRPTIDSKGLEKISAPLGRITGQADEFTKSMEAANARVLAFGASVGVLNAVAKSFEKIVVASTQVEASLKEIQVATGETSGNLEKLGKGIFEVARSTGLSFKEASAATLEFARQGGTLEDSLMKAKAALVLTRTTGLDAAEAVKGLTAAVLSFNQVGLDYETVVNKLAAVDTKFAVSSKDLIEGISRSASVAQEAGVSFDELTALITTLQEKTARGGAVIGNALKTIFQRVQTTENLDYIRNLGIAVNDVSGDILPATTIIKKLADEFQNLDSATRKGLLIKIGGGFQIDKLAALLNDISSANGTFNRSLQQSTNAGNQGFQKLDELNKTVQASFDRLKTSGTEFAATVGKIAFSDDFRSVLNKTSSFLESLNESISGGEEGGATIGKAIVKGIGSIITGPGALLLAGLGIKLFGDLAKFGVDSLKNQLGVTNVKKEQQDIEKSILGLLLQNTAVQTKIVSLEGNKTAQAEYLLGLYSKQAATLEKMSKLSKDISPSVYEGGIRLTAEGTKNVNAKTAASGYMPLGDAIKSEKRNAPAGAKIILDKSFPMGGGEIGPMVYNSSETRIKNFANGGDAIIPNFANPANKPVGQINTQSVAGLTIGGAKPFITPRAKELSFKNGGLTNVGNILQNSENPKVRELVEKFSSIQFAQPVPVGNIYRRGSKISESEDEIVEGFRERINQELSPRIAEVIEKELQSLGIEPTKDIARAFSVGEIFNLVGKSEAGLIFENMLRISNLNSDEIAKFAGSDDSPFDIYDLNPDLAKQMLGQEKGFDYVEVRSQTSALADALTTKYLNQLMKQPSKLLPTISAKTAAEGYVPNFAGTTNFEGSASRFSNKIGQVYNQGEEAIKSTFNNPKTAFRGTRTGEAAYRTTYGFKLDEKGIIASILGNNTFVAGKDQRQELETLATRLSAQGATMKGSQNMLGLNISRLDTRPENVISANIKGKFKKINYEKLDKIFPRFWKSKGLGQVWENSKLHATFTGADKFGGMTGSPHIDILKIPEVRKLIDNPNLARENNALLRNSAVEAVLKRDPSIAGFLVDLAGSSEEEYLRGFKEKSGISYAMPFSGSPFSDIESVGVKKDAIKKAEQERKINENKKIFRERGVLYKEFVKNKSEFLKYGQWGGNGFYKNGTIYLRPDAVKTSAKGYVPNFASGDIDGDGTVTRNDPFIKKLMDSAKKFSPIAKELTNNIVGNLLGLPEGADLFEMIEQLKFAQKASEPEAELNRIKREAKLKRKNEKIEDFLKRYKGTPPEGPTRTAAKGYVPNFSKQAVLDAIGREQKESGLPLSAIKVVQDSRVQGPQNPNGYAVINNRDEPDGKVPNFADPTPKQLENRKNPDFKQYLKAEVESLSKGIKYFNDALKKVTESLDQRNTQKYGPLSSIPKEEISKILTEVRNQVKLGSPKTASELRAAFPNAPGAAKDPAKVQEQQTKTVQDSLYTLLKWQTAIAGVTGALSVFGGNVAKAGETVGSIASAYVTLRESKGLRDDFLGKNKEGKQNTFRDAFSGKIEGKTKMGSIAAGVGAAVATGGAYFAAAVAAVQGLDSALQIIAKTSKKSELSLIGLTQAQEKYSVSLTASQKKIQERLTERFDVSGAATAGFFNQTGITGLFRGQTTKDIKKLAPELGLNEKAFMDNASYLSSFVIPQVQQELGPKATTDQVEKESTRRTLEIFKELTKNSKGYYQNQATAEGLYEERFVQSSQGSFNQKRFNDLLIQKGKSMMPQTDAAAYATKLQEEALTINANIEKRRLEIVQEIAKAYSSMPTALENSLSITKDLFSTSEQDRSNIDYKLKILEEERRLRAEINDTILSSAKNEIFSRLGEGKALTEPLRQNIETGFKNINEATSVEDKKIKLQELSNSLIQRQGGLSDGLKKIIEEKLKVINQEIERSQELSSITKKNIAQQTLNKAIIDQQNNALNIQKEILNSRLEADQKSLQYNKERLAILRNISDIEFDKSILEMNEGPMKDYLSSIQQAQSQAQKAFDDLEARKKEKMLTDEKSYTSYITANTNDLRILDRADKAKGNPLELKKIVEEVAQAQTDSFEKKVINAAEEFAKIVTGAGNVFAGKQPSIKLNDAITQKSTVEDVFGKTKEDYAKMSDVRQLTAARTAIESSDKFKEMSVPAAGGGRFETLGPGALSDQEKEIYYQILESQKKSIELQQKYSQLKSSSLTSTDIPTLETQKQILTQLELQTAEAEKRKRLNTGFSGGFESSMRQIQSEIANFDNQLGKQIPMNFRDGLVDAMKALSDPTATNSLKERLMGVATAFLNKINEAFMQQTANQIVNLFSPRTYASGGAIVGGSGNKDDVPAMLMGGEYVIKKNVVNKYGKDFFDKLNSGKIKGFASGGLAQLNYDDLAQNKSNYVPFGTTLLNDLQIDEKGEVIGISNYQGEEQNKNFIMKKAQTQLYENALMNPQSGQGGFQMPGQNGAGAIIGQKNLLAFSTQQTQGTAYDKFASGANRASINLAAGSSNLSLFGLTNADNPMNQELVSSKQQAFDLYLQGLQASAQKADIIEQERQRIIAEQKAEEERRRQEEEMRKEQKKAQRRGFLTSLVTAGISAGASYLMGAAGSAFSSGSSSALSAKTSAINAGVGQYGGYGKDNFGQDLWAGNLATSKNTSLTFSEKLFGYQGNGGLFSSSSWGSSPSTSFPSFTQTTYDGKFVPRAIPVGRVVPAASPLRRYAVGGYVAGNGMGDNVPAMLNGGEFVISKQAAEKVGYNKLQNLNSGAETNSDELISKLELKLDELISKISSKNNNINITVESGGKSKEDSSGSDDKEQKELARKIKEVVMTVITDEKRIGGFLR